MVENDDLQQIIAGCKNNEAEGFSKLVDIYASRLYGYFYRLTGNRDVSDELLSELFVRLVEKIGYYKRGSFDGWLFKVASNIFHDHLRAKRRDKKLLEGKKKLLEAETTGNAKSERGENDLLQKQLGKLDEETKGLIIMRFYSQLSFKEIAQMRAEPIGTTLSKVHRGLKKLREMMD